MDRSFKKKKKFNSSQEAVSKQQVMQMIMSKTENPLEAKFLDVLGNTQNIDFSGTLQVLTNPTQGIGVNQRTGDAIKLKMVSLSCNVTANSGDYFNLCRIYIIQYHPQATPFVTTFLEVTGSGAAPISFKNWPTQKDYKILWDSKPFSVCYAATNSMVQFKVDIPLKNVIEFSTAATTASDHVYLLYISDSGATPYPTISYYVRTTFFDQ